MVSVLKAFTIPESVRLHFTCPAVTPYESTQLVLIYFFKRWWEWLLVDTLWNERPLHHELNTSHAHV